jgi:hypothetical protein
MDEFGWGNTRLVIGEGSNKKIVMNDDERFDESMIPLKKFSGMCSHTRMLCHSHSLDLKSTKLKHGNPVLATQKTQAMTLSHDPEADLVHLRLDRNQRTATTRPRKQGTITGIRTSHKATTRTRIFEAVNSLTATTHSNKQPSCHQPCLNMHLRCLCLWEVQGLSMALTWGMVQELCRPWLITTLRACTACFHRSRRRTP